MADGRCFLTVSYNYPLASVYTITPGCQFRLKTAPKRKLRAVIAARGRRRGRQVEKDSCGKGNARVFAFIIRAEGNRVLCRIKNAPRVAEYQGGQGGGAFADVIQLKSVVNVVLFNA